MIVVEMNRLLTGMIQVIQEIDTNTGYAICNERTCTTMSAGRYASESPVSSLSLYHSDRFQTHLYVA
jgi:hypothetical protein